MRYVEINIHVKKDTTQLLIVNPYFLFVDHNLFCIFFQLKVFKSLIL